MPESRPYVLLTGATGMVGAQLLARLMRRHVPVMVLVRDKGPQSAAARVDQVLARFERAWQRRLGRPAVISGDMAAPRLGLSRGDERIIHEHCGTVLHCAASMSFRPAADSPNNEPFRTNVDGTAALLELCKAALIDQFHYVSTAYVCGVRSGVAQENELDVGQSFANDYERSKVRAEQLLRSATHLTRLTVYRPSIVIDSDGSSPFAQDRTIYGAFSLFRALTSKFGIPHNGQWFRNLGFAGTEHKNLVEAQWVADVIDGIFATPRLHDQTYHVTDRTGTPIHEIEAAFVNVVSQTQAQSHAQTEHHSDPAHRKTNGAHKNGASKNGSTSLHRAAAVPGRSTSEHDLIDTIAAPYVQTFLPYFKDDPVFDRRHLERALAELAMDDHPHVGSTTIARVASVQLAQESPAVARQRDDRAADKPLDVVHQLLARWTAAEHDPTSEAVEDDPASQWGVFITGPDGGDWRLNLHTMSIAPAGQTCAQRLYCDSQTWNRLVQQPCGVAEALATGRLIIEWDELESNRTNRPVDSQIEHLFAQLVEYTNHQAWERQRD